LKVNWLVGYEPKGSHKSRASDEQLKKQWLLKQSVPWS